MISYTKRNVSLLAISMAILFIIFFHLMYAFVEILSNKFYSNQIYSKKISSYSEENKAKSNIVTISEEGSKAYNNIIVIEENKTQRQIVKEYQKNAWRIQIPKINLDIHIKEGTTPNTLLEAVGHFEHTSKWKGNVGLAAHNRGYQCNYFQNIKNLKIGDEIIYTTENGKRVYQVQTNKVILETNWNYLKPTKQNCITLITCEENRKEYRRCIQGVESYEILNEKGKEDIK